MIKYHNGKRVKEVRSFMLNGTHYSEIIQDSESTIVKLEELSDERGEWDEIVSSVGESEVVINQDSVDIKGEKIIFKSPITIVDMINDTPVDDSNEDQIDTRVVLGGVTELIQNSVRVTAINKQGKKFDLGSKSELAESKTVQRFKLDPLAIERCLSGEQKQHKGYTFELAVSGE